MTKDIIFLDLDGTILDVSERIYRVYADILKNNGKNEIIPKKEYWEMKRNKTPLAEILKKTGAEDILEKFKKEWDDNVESAHYIKEYDSIFPGAVATLSALNNVFDLALITLRDNRNNLFEEIKDLDLEKFFKKIMVESGKGVKDKYLIKSRLIEEWGGSGQKIAIVGDTETEIMAGKQTGIKTVAVTSGIRSCQILSSYGPDFVIDKFSEIKIDGSDTLFCGTFRLK